MDGYLISSSSNALLYNHLHQVLICPQPTVPGSIVANKSFIAQFATERTAKGAMVLDPRYVGGFTAVQSIGQIIGMVSGGWVSF